MNGHATMDDGAFTYQGIKAFHAFSARFFLFKQNMTNL
jgi:putative copper export protein